MVDHGGDQRARHDAAGHEGWQGHAALLWVANVPPVGRVVTESD